MDGLGAAPVRPKRRVFAPDVNSATLDNLADIMAFFEINPQRTRINRCTELLCNLRARLTQKFGEAAHPGMIISYLADEYAPSTARGYAITMQQIDPSLKQQPAWTLALKRLHEWCAEDENRPQGAFPATPDQVRLLIGNLATPHQRAIYQLWVASSRYGESIGHTDAAAMGRGLHTPRTWHVRHWARFGVIELWIPTHKGAAQGQRPYSKWIRITDSPLGRVTMEQAWRPHHVEYWDLLGYVKSLCPFLSLHSFRKGAIKFLEEMAQSPTRIAMLSGHQDASKVKSLLKSYRVSDPRQRGAQRMMMLTTALQVAIGL